MGDGCAGCGGEGFAVGSVDEIFCPEGLVFDEETAGALGDACLYGEIWSAFAAKFGGWLRGHCSSWEGREGGGACVHFCEMFGLGEEESRRLGKVGSRFFESS